MAFSTIYIAQGVTERDYRRAMRARGPGIAERRTMIELCERAGFVRVRERDLTADFMRTTRTYMEMAARYEDELRAAWGDARYEESQSSRRATLRLVSEGIVRRGLFVGVAPR